MDRHKLYSNNKYVTSADVSNALVCVFTYLVLGPVTVVVIGPGVFDDNVFGGDGVEGRGVNARGTRRGMMPRQLRRRLRGRCPSRRGALLHLGLMATADPVAAAAAARAATSTPEEAAAA